MTPEGRHARTADGTHVAYQAIGRGPVDIVVIRAWYSDMVHEWQEPVLTRMFRHLESSARLDHGSALSLSHPSGMLVPMPDPGPFLPPQVGREDAWEPITERFTCDQCGANACTLILLPPFARDPHVSNPGTPPGMDRIFADSVRLSIDGPVKTTHTFLPGMDIDLSALDAALRARDVTSLYEMDLEYVPFWCRSCSKSYCRACWVLWVEYDEGFYDCTRGRCPVGHERLMDD